jgi:hypothetical protein
MQLNKKLKETVTLIEQYLLSKIIRNPTELFEATPEGFQKTKLWAKSKPHPFFV